MSMKGKDHTLMKAAASADLMVCFPSRSSLSLRPKSVFCPGELANLRCPQSHLPPHLKRTNARGVGMTMSSPLLRGPQTKQMGSDNAEPTSPKVSCAGQIKAPSKSNKGGKSGQSLIEEIERIHNKKGKKQRIHWLRSLGLKKEVGQLLSCLRGLRFDLHLRCLRNLPDTSDEDEDDGEGENNSNTLFSKWFMVLQENHNYDLCRRHKVSAESIAPPPNALLLMRCRSAPVRRLSAKEEEEVENSTENKDGGETTKKLRCLMDEEKMKEELEDEQTKKMMKKKKKECYVEMRETWFIARSKSWKS